MLKPTNEVVVTREPKLSRTEIKRLGKFGIVGALNTLIDFTLYNLLSGAGGLTLIQANICSTTIAMVFSFAANKHVVFERKGGRLWRQALIFLVVTAFGLYVLQTLIIHVLTEVWTNPVTLAVWIAHSVGFRGHDQFVIKNTAKLVATFVTLIWNYFAYKKVVFK